MTDVDNPAPVNCLEWFYGGGGNHLGLCRVVPGLRVIAACEIEAYAVANVVAQIEGGLLAPFPLWTDIKTFPLETFRGLVDLFVASYPCQGFSAAGKREGERDPRFLWPWVFQAVVVIRPGRVFFENVEGHVTLGLATVLSDLAAAGYRCAWGIFSAEECGASHRRKRVFIMADRADGRFNGLGLSKRPSRSNKAAPVSLRTGEGVADAGCAERRQSESAGNNRNGSDAGREQETSGVVKSGAPVADSLRGRNGRRQQQRDGTRPGAKTDNCSEALAYSSSGGQRELRESSRGERFSDGRDEDVAHSGGERFQGLRREITPPVRDGCHAYQRSALGQSIPKFPPGPGDLDLWREIIETDPSLEPALCRMADGMAYRVDRLRLCGNGVFPDTAALAYVTLDRELVGFTP